MIVAGPEGFVKNQYRKFNIKAADLTPGDDFAMMREVLTRRFKRLLKEHGLPPTRCLPRKSWANQNPTHRGRCANSANSLSDPSSWPGLTRPSIPGCRRGSC